MEIIYIVVIGFAIYGGFAALSNYSRSQKADADKFQQQLSSFRAGNPEVLVACSGPGACRYHVIYRAKNGKTIFQFLESHRDAKRHAQSLRADGIGASISWLGPSQELLDPWKTKST